MKTPRMERYATTDGTLRERYVPSKGMLDGERLSVSYGSMHNYAEARRAIRAQPAQICN